MCLPRPLPPPATERPHPRSSPLRGPLHPWPPCRTFTPPPLFGALLRFPLAPEEEGERSAKEHDNCKARGIASCAVFFTSVLLSSFTVAPRKQYPLLRQFSPCRPARPPPNYTTHSSSTVCYYYCYWASTTKTMYSDLRKRQKHVVWRPRAARERKRPIFGGTRQQQGLVRELLSDGGGSSGDDSLHVRPRPRVQSFDSSWEGGRKMRAPFSRSRSRSLLSSHHRCKRVAFACLAVPPAHVRIVDPPRPEGRGEHCT